MRMLVEYKIIDLLRTGPQKTEEIAKTLYPVGRGCGRVKKQKVYANIYYLKKKGYKIELINNSYYLLE